MTHNNACRYLGTYLCLLLSEVARCDVFQTISSVLQVIRLSEGQLHVIKHECLELLSTQSGMQPMQWILCWVTECWQCTHAGCQHRREQQAR